MEIALTLSKIINIIALLFLFLGAYGIAMTGALQVLAAIIYFFAYPKNRLIYIYFGLVGVFFLFWNGSFNWWFSIPIFLLVFLTYIIKKKKNKS